MSYGYGNVGGSYDYKCSNVGGIYDRKRDCKFDFVLIVVLFILLIIVGTHFCKNGY